MTATRAREPALAPWDFSQIDRCNKCGFCLAVCPTYRETGLEAQSPRGRLALIRGVAHAELELGPRIIEHMYHCLYCTACENVCPAGIRIATQIARTRAVIESHRSQPFLKRLLLRYLLPFPNRLEWAVLPLRLYQRLGIRWLVRKAGLLHLLPPRLRRMEALLPVLPWRPLRQTLPSTIPARGERRHRVGFFVGCVMNLAYDGASRASIQVLAENGCDVLFARDHGCCGAPHEDQGDLETLRALARRNIDLFAALDLDFIISDSAACSAATKAYAHILEFDPAYREKARDFSGKIRDITEFLASIPLAQPRRRVRRKVTYQDPCHLCHAQGIVQQPRDLLRWLPGVELVEQRDATWCCGSAGSYVITHPRRSSSILSKKMENIRATGADTIVTTNPGCLLQLEAGVRQKGYSAEVKHLSELLWEAYGTER